MTGLSRCGKQYRTFDAALMAGELRTSKGAKPLAVVSCDLGEHWHLVPPRQAIGRQYVSLDPFPPAVRKQLAARDECCQRCGHTGRLEAHHRRAKASGGSSARAHTQCACNGVLLCRKCHEWVHLNPRQARAEGWIVLQSVSKPATVPLSSARVPIVNLGLTEPIWLPIYGYHPTCEGGWDNA